MILSALDSEKTYRLIQKWETCTENLPDFHLNIEEFLPTAKETCFLLAKVFDLKYSVLQFPKEVVSLLLHIQTFANYNGYVNVPSRAAQLVAATLCDVDNCCGIVHPNPENNPEEWQFEVKGETEYHVIDMNTFDLSELKRDVD